MGRWIQTAQSTRTPSRLCSVSISRITQDRQSVLGSWHLSYQRRRGPGLESPLYSESGDTGPGLWDALRRLCGRSSLVYTIMEDGADGATLAGVWSEIRTGKLQVIPHGTTVSSALNRAGQRRQRHLPLVMGQSADILALLHPGGQIRIVAPRNHGFVYQLQELRPALRGHEHRQLKQIGIDSFDQLPDQWRSLVQLRWMQHLFRWWQLGQCGPWRDSIGSLGLAWWRRCVPKKSVLVHDCQAAHAAEITACYGARAETRFFGTQCTRQAEIKHSRAIPGAASPAQLQARLVEIDYRAMYVSIMSRERFPTKLLGELPRRRWAALDKVLESFDLIATVTLQTDQAAYPYRDGKAVCFPTGRWLTTLTSPELRYALQHGHIAEIHQVWQYETGYPLRDFASAALSLRWLAESQKDSIGARLIKAASNALTGKLASKQTQWKDRPGLRARQTWGQYQVIDYTTGQTAWFRAIGGRVQERIDTDKRTPGLTAIYAHVTAYGRQLSWAVAQAAGNRGLVYWDTDGGLVTQGGLDGIRSSGIKTGNNPGELRVLGHVSASVHRGKARYWRDGKYTLSGVPAGWMMGPGGQVRWTETINPARHGQDPERDPLTSVDRSLEWDRLSTATPYDSSGWASSLFVSGGKLLSELESVDDS